MTNATQSPHPAVVERERTHPIVAVENYLLRSFKAYRRGEEPYDMQDALGQKLWAVVAEEFGPNVADVLVTKLQDAVVHHITKTGRGA
jgi:hypothetical protein